MNFLWRIDMFGGLRAVGGARVIGRFRTHKTGALLAYLALFPDRPHTREALLELLWADEPLDAARNALRVALSSLRRQMEPPGTPSGAVLVADRSKIQISPVACTTDVAEFEAALASASRGDDGADQAALLGRAVGLYRGDLLPALYDDWALGERERLAQACLGALHRLTRLLTLSGDFDRALDFGLRAVPFDPLCEKSHRILMRLYAASGRPDAARQQFRVLTRILHVEVNGVPDSKTRDLAARLDALESAPAPDKRLDKRAAGTDATGTGAAVPKAAATPPPAPQRLDSEESEREGSGAAADSLPVTFTRFFGRTEERAALTALLADPQARLVTLTGPGGNGKTRLAVEAARGLGGAFPGGVWFVPLADLADPAGLGEAIRAVLRGPRPLGADPWGQVVAALAGPPALLVLDNFEQITAGAAPAVESLLRRVPALTCLVTSRRRLDVSGEREMPLAPLPVPALSEASEPETAEQVARSASTQVFVDRAQAVRPDFAVTDRSAPDLAALCRALEGIPLALELAAARIRALSLPQMRARLEQRFELLASRRGDKGMRHRSLWAAIEWSYDLLPAHLQQFFAGLSVFRGGWTLEAAEAVCGQPAALDALAQLRASSLVGAEDALPDLRFRLLESLREFGWEQLSPAQREAAGDRHAAFFAALSARAGDVLKGPDQGDWLRRFEADSANLQLALDRLESQQERGGAALSMATDLYHFWLLSGRQHEGRSRLDRLLARPADSDAARADALTVAGNLAEAEGDLPGARTRLEEAVALHLHGGRDAHAARARGDLGIVAARQGRPDEARAHWEANLSYWQGRNEPLRAAGVLNNLATLARRQGDFDEAQMRLEECLALNRQAGDMTACATVLHNLGLTADSRGDLEEAVRRFGECLALQRTQGNVRGIANSLVGLGATAYKRGIPTEAQALLTESLALFAKMEDTGGILHCLQGLAEVWLALGLPESAAVARGALMTMYQVGGITQSAVQAEASAHTEQALTAALGPDRFAATHARGEALSPLQAAEYALSVCRHTGAPGQ
jgi:predicted ATPase/DNA-binding SARP family transcriptional activator/Tfp pilus assembly protein PilF